MIRDKIAADGRKISWIAAQIDAPMVMLSCYLSGKHIPKYERRIALAALLEIPALAEENTWRAA